MKQNIFRSRFESNLGPNYNENKTIPSDYRSNPMTLNLTQNRLKRKLFSQIHRLNAISAAYDGGLVDPAMPLKKKWDRMRFIAP